MTVLVLSIRTALLYLTQYVHILPEQSIESLLTFIV